MQCVWGLWRECVYGAPGLAPNPHVLTVTDTGFGFLRSMVRGDRLLTRTGTPPPVAIPQDTVEIATSYADSGVYQFNQVFEDGFTYNDVFERLTPVLNDAFFGINGAIMVCASVAPWDHIVYIIR